MPQPPPPADDAPLPTETLGPYRLRDRLGTRGRFIAWRAEDAAGRPVGVQVLAAGPPPDVAAAERFADGAERLAGLRHPNVLQVLGHGAEGGRLYLATEPASLGTLGGLLRERPPSLE